jgi:hypothetical protein
MALPLIFDFYNSIIEVPAPDTTLEMQYLINEIRDTEDELTPGMAHPKIADASGKDDLGGGIYTAITVRLLDNWRVRFEARTELTQCTISGGNLVGGPGGNPIAPSAFTQVIQLSSASGVIATPTTSSENTNLRYILASLGEIQKGIGDVYYWDPISGSDANTGLTPTAAVQTFAKAHDDLVTTGHHDVIFCLSSDPTGITTVTETLNITKNTLKVRGPGHVFQLVPIATTDDTVVISANDVEISGLYISTATSGTKNAVTVTGDNALIKDCWISIVRGHGLNLSSTAKTIVDTAVIEHCGASGTGNGINLGQDTTETKIKKCLIFDNKTGVLLSGTGLADNLVEDCLVYKNTAYGANIGSGVLRTTLRGGNTLTNNTPDNTLDNGTDTYIETPAGGASTSEIADAVWAEVITDVTTPGSAGKTLKDAKTKATLASLS